MTIEEVEKLIDEHAEACMEWQAYVDDQFEDENPQGLKDNIQAAFDKLIEAILELERLAFEKGMSE